MNERVKDLSCRQDCPYTKVINHFGKRPCVKEVAKGEKFCTDSIQLHFSERNIEPISLAVTGKKIEIYNEKNIQVGTVVNGVANLKTIYPIDLTKLNL